MITDYTQKFAGRSQKVAGNSQKYDSAKALLLHYGHEVPHVLHVRYLACILFDQLAELHPYGREERELLECGALLHDIGWAVSSRKHHKHSMELILDADLPAFSPREKRMVANIARYHRKTLPKSSHAEFVKLEFKDRDIVRKLSAFVRLADAFDKHHSSRVTDIRCEMEERSCNLFLKSREFCPEEYQAFLRKKDLFEITFKRTLNFYTTPHYQEEALAFVR